MRLLIIILITCTNILFAQNLDSLKEAIKNYDKNSEEYTSSVLKLAKNYRRKSPDSTLKYTNLLLKSDINYHDSVFALAHKLSGDAYIYKSKLILAEKEYNTAIKLYNKLGNNDKILDIKNNLGIVYQFSGQYNKAVKLYKESLENDIKKQNNEGVSKAYNNLGTVYTKIGKNDSAIYFLKKSLKIKSQLKDSLGLSKTYHNIGDLYLNDNKFTEALKYYKKSLLYKTLLKDSVYMSVTLANIGLVYKKIALYDKATEYLFSALDIASKTGNTKQMAEIYNTIASTYDEWSTNDTANKYYQQKVIEFYNKALKINEQNKDYEGLINVINNIGTYYLQNKNYDDALTYFLKSLRYAKDKNMVKKQIVIYNNMSDVFIKKENYNEAKYYLNKSLSLLEKYNDNESRYIVYNKLSEIYIGENKLDLAKKYALMALEIAQENKQNNKIKGVYKQLFLIYSLKKEDKKALDYHLKYCHLKDSIFSNNTKKMLLTLETKYQTKQQQQQIKLLDTENKLSKTALKAKSLRLKQQRLISIGLTVIVIIVLVFIILLRKQIKEKIKANNLLRLSNEEIKSQRDKIQEQFTIIKKQNTEITDSINYARLIQEAILPPNNILSQYFNSSFIYFKPKSIVSGDFYWVAEYKNKVIVAAVDCTGHGVPGAFMSMLGVSFLNDIIAELNDVSSKNILNILRSKVIKSLKQSISDDSRKDGMDMALAIIDRNLNEIEFSGAYNPLILIREQELNDDNDKIKLLDKTKLKINTNKYIYEVKADRMPISIYRKQENFSSVTFKYNPKDRIFLFSDGFMDQFHHKTMKKFKKNKLISLFVSNSDKDITALTPVLDNTLANWKKDSEQTDDILIIGIELV